MACVHVYAARYQDLGDMDKASEAFELTAK